MNLRFGKFRDPKGERATPCACAAFPPSASFSNRDPTTSYRWPRIFFAPSSRNRKVSSNETMRDALEASGCEIVTVALRRANLSGKKDPFANILDFIDPKKYLLLPNTSGAMNADEAVRLARLAAAAGLPQWVKLEIHPDPHYLLPDPIETLAAAEILVKEGFTVLPYINADPVLARRLQDVGTATVMPLGSPIGSNRGLDTRSQIEIIIKQATVPVVVDAGIGAPSHAAGAS
jgi:thiazole synthase